MMICQRRALHCLLFAFAVLLLFAFLEVAQREKGMECVGDSEEGPHPVSARVDTLEAPESLRALHSASTVPSTEVTMVSLKCSLFGVSGDRP